MRERRKYNLIVGFVFLFLLICRVILILTDKTGYFNIEYLGKQTILEVLFFILICMPEISLIFGIITCVCKNLMAIIFGSISIIFTILAFFIEIISYIISRLDGWSLSPAVKPEIDIIVLILLVILVANDYKYRQLLLEDEYENYEDLEFVDKGSKKLKKIEKKRARKEKKISKKLTRRTKRQEKEEKRKRKKEEKANKKQDKINKKLAKKNKKGEKNNG